MAAVTTGGAHRRMAEHVFFSGMALLCAALAVWGFGRSYFFAGMITARLGTPLVHVHAAILTCWLVVQGIQPLLVASQRTRWHRRLGVAGMVLAAAVPLVGILTAIGEVRRHKYDVEMLAGDLAFGMAASIDFAVLAFLGLRCRIPDASAHKRLMLLASLSILGPVIGRLPFASGATMYYATFAALLVLPISFDLGALHRVHRKTLLGVALVAVSQALAEIISRGAIAQRAVVWIQDI